MTLKANIDYLNIVDQNYMFGVGMRLDIGTQYCNISFSYFERFLNEFVMDFLKNVVPLSVLC